MLAGYVWDCLTFMHVRSQHAEPAACELADMQFALHNIGSVGDCQHTTFAAWMTWVGCFVLNQLGGGFLENTG